MTLRPTLSTLPAYVPGRSVPGAIKLASNEVPYPPLPSVVDAITAAAAGMNRYPDTFSGALSEALAAKYGVDVARVRVGCGSVSLCTQLVQAVADADDEVMYAWRSFEAYPILTAISGASSVQVPLTDGYVHDLDAMAERITGKTRLVFVCNPNNPTGTAVSRDALVRFLRAVPHDVVVALDEAYREFVRDDSVPDGLTLLDEFPNVVVLRTFSKAYGLAGLRVGYAIAADPAIAAAMAQTQVPFAVTTVAQAAALASLQPAAEAELLERVGRIVGERTRVRDVLVGLGYDVPPTQANFVWLPLGDAATRWAQGAEAQGLVTRAFAGSGVRVTISSVEENDALLRAAESLA
ncbi:histidinol-phosphate transaminase [Jatrophihabitans endophyticus]|uniref:histidinol-phosphate transaminase n=1 Tax=Jatrophihabitans endophyticus TaxID=1206085 RepID=UPI001A0F1FF9|nr:histidinol-phosphate transaminase [Jatrophihabitans endophyticus]MBE7189932.1 histidinol-phosphate transaminase [Jatrophihabitans endophyticus]